MRAGSRMKGAAFLDLLARWFPATNSLKSIGLPLGLAVTVAVTALTQGATIVRWFGHRAATAQAKADGRLTDAATAIGADGVGRLAAHGREIGRIDTATREGEHDVLRSIGADAPAPGVAAALHDALCLSDAYQAEPDCRALRADRAGLGAAGADPGRPASGER